MSTGPTSVPPSSLVKDAVGVTDLSPPSRAVFYNVVVKVKLEGDHAFISSKDGSIKERFPIGMLAKRFGPGETVAYFNSSIKKGLGALEIGERIHTVKGGEW